MSVGTFVDATLQAGGRSPVPALNIDRGGRIIRCQSAYLLRVPDAVETHAPPRHRYVLIHLHLYFSEGNLYKWC
jgi:hypothetical protein